jgi:hypothetical protein
MAIAYAPRRGAGKCAWLDDRPFAAGSIIGCARTVASSRIGGGLDREVGALREVGAVAFDTIVDRSRAIARSRGARIAARRLACAFGVALSLACSDSTAGGGLRPILFVGRTSNPRGEVTERAGYLCRAERAKRLAPTEGGTLQRAGLRLRVCEIQ